MIRWEERPVEIANLFNPAFCGEILRRCISSYQQTNSLPLPYPLLFLVLPIILHRDTRERISPRQRLTLHAWLQKHPGDCQVPDLLDAKTRVNKGQAANHLPSRT